MNPPVTDGYARAAMAVIQVAGPAKKVFAAAAAKLTIRMFESPAERTEFPVYINTLRLFRRGEIVSLCKKALTEEGPLDTRELALRVMRTKGFDEGDSVLRTSITYRIVQAMRLQVKRGRMNDQGKRKGVVVWQAP